MRIVTFYSLHFFILILSLEIHCVMINNKNKLLMTSIIAMTFLIGFTANEAYAGEIPDTCDDCTTSLLVHIDIKPESCPNPVNSNSRGVVPVAILGSADFDVSQIDVSTILIEGFVSPVKHNIEDVATPHTPVTAAGDPLDCSTEGPDGFDDLTLKFDTFDIIVGIGLTRGSVVQLLFTGNLLDGTEIHGYDTIIVK